MVEDACLSHGVELRIVHEASSIAVQKAMVARGDGFSFLPGSCIADDVTRPCFTTVAGMDLTRHLAVFLAPGRAASPAAREAIAELRRLLAARIASGDWPGAVWIGPPTRIEKA